MPGSLGGALGQGQGCHLCPQGLRRVPLTTPALGLPVLPPPRPTWGGGCSKKIISVGLRKKEWRTHSTRTQGPNPRQEPQLPFSKACPWGLAGQELNKT